MNEKRFLLVVYDITNDRRRTKLHDKLADFGTPVQYSVFELELTNKQCTQMKNMIKRIIRPRQDRVRIYYLCEDCRKKTEIFGRKDKDTGMVLVVK